jgi:phosphorylase kinase alpha/beta subunit
MGHCKGLVIGDKLERRNRLESELIRAEMTAGEKNFALQVEHLLHKIHAPEYRCLNLEALTTLAALVECHPTLQVDDVIVLDVLIGHAVRLAWRQGFLQQGQEPPDDAYGAHKAAAWAAFYERSPRECAQYTKQALQFLLELGQATAP